MSRRRRKVEAVGHAVEAWIESITQGLTDQRQRARLEAPAPSQEELETFSGFFVQLLEAQLEALENAASELRKVRSELKDLRRDRDELARREVYDRVVRLRRSVASAGGKLAEEKLFGPGKTPREAPALASQAHDLCHRIEHRELREFLIEDPEKQAYVKRHAEDLKEPLDRLETKLGQITEAQGRESRLQCEVETWKTELRRSQTHTFKLLEGLLGVADLEDLARDLRPRSRRNRPKKPSPDVPEPPAEGPEASEKKGRDPEAEKVLDA